MHCAVQCTVQCSAVHRAETKETLVNMLEILHKQIKGVHVCLFRKVLFDSLMVGRQCAETCSCLEINANSCAGREVCVCTDI